VTRAPLALPGRTVIFDYGDVISLPQSKTDQAVMEHLAGVDGDEAGAHRFWAAYQAHRDGLDQGTVSVASYWRAIADDTGARWDQARVHELWVADLRSWLSVNPLTAEVLADLRSGGTPLALLSNAGPEFGGYFRNGPLGDLFDACYVSGELGLLKPHPEIYQHVLRDLGIAPAEAVFVDNRASNVAGAQALGIAGHVFTDGTRLRAFLSELAGLPAGAAARWSSCRRPT
jgi:putative hydrolase of the HAD superfamily